MKIAKIVVVVVCLIAAVLSNSCKQTGKQAATGINKIRVVTTLFPLYDMAKNVGGTNAEVSLLLPPGIEAHSFEPKPSDVARISEADIFVYTGKFMEPWAESIIKGVIDKKLVVIDASRNTKMVPGMFHHAEGPSGPADPHIWLDFDNAVVMVKNIMRAFQSKDAANKAFYEQKADEYTRKLAEMDAAFRTGLSDCRYREIVYAGHYAFGYLAKRYGLKYHAAQGVSPDSEPTARDLVRLVSQIKKDGIKYIFYEELTSPKIAETIAGETKAKMLLLNAGHNLPKDSFDSGVSFLDILKLDLANLKTGLECR